MCVRLDEVQLAFCLAQIPSFVLLACGCGAVGVSPACAFLIGGGGLCVRHPTGLVCLCALHLPDAGRPQPTRAQANPGRHSARGARESAKDACTAQADTAGKSSRAGRNEGPRHSVRCAATLDHVTRISCGFSYVVRGQELAAHSGQAHRSRWLSPSGLADLACPPPQRQLASQARAGKHARRSPAIHRDGYAFSLKSTRPSFVRPECPLFPALEHTQRKAAALPPKAWAPAKRTPLIFPTGILDEAFPLSGFHRVTIE